MTPDELYHFGEKHFAKKDYEQAHEHLTTVVRGLAVGSGQVQEHGAVAISDLHLAMQGHSDTVKYFEILKERFPDVELTFEDILNVAKSYREIGEYERSYLVYRATVEGQFRA